jgi:hypothetical protein
MKAHEARSPLGTLRDRRTGKAHLFGQRPLALSPEGRIEATWPLADCLFLLPATNSSHTQAIVEGTPGGEDLAGCPRGRQVRLSLVPAGGLSTIAEYPETLAPRLAVAGLRG